MSRIYRATIRATDNTGVLLQPSFHYKVDVPAAGSEPPADDVADSLWGHWGTAFRTCLPTFDHVDALVVTEAVVPPDVGVQGSHAVNANGLFGSGNNDLPQGLAAILNLHTGTVSRSARGHTAMPCPGDRVTLVNRKWAGGFDSALQALADLLNDSITMGGTFPPTLVPVVYSRTRAMREQTPFSFDVTRVSVNLIPHWLRSRQTSP